MIPTLSNRFCLGNSFDPDEPQHLHPDVLWRIQFLKYMYPDTSDLHESELASIHAVLDAYRTENLQVDLEKVTVWFGGNMVMGPMSREELDVEILNMPVDEWRERFGPGMVWIEEVCCLQPAIHGIVVLQ